MIISEAKKMVEAKLKCMERDVSGKDDDCNNHRCYECPLNYEQGNMGEQKEWLRMSIEALEFMPLVIGIVSSYTLSDKEQIEEIEKIIDKYPEARRIYHGCLGCFS